MPTSFADMYGGRRHHDEGRNENDFYPTPPFATYALVQYDRVPQTIWEPACGKGYMAKELERCGRTVFATDLHEYEDHLELKEKPYFGFDFLAGKTYCSSCDGIVTNPPYASGLAMKFVLAAISMPIMDCNYAAFLCRTNFVEGKTRYEQLFSKHPPTRIWTFTNRFSCWEKNFDNPLGGMVNFSWFVWEKNQINRGGPIFGWIDTYKMFDKWWESNGRDPEQNPRRSKRKKKPSGESLG